MGERAAGPEEGIESAPARSRPAQLAARYRSLFVLGRGGMGTVEAALEIEPPGDSRADRREYERVVALKRLLPDAARDKRRVEMFLREARLAAMLDHPNVVRAFDYGEIDGELYLAMEYVEGQPLSRVLRALSDANEKMPAAVTMYILAEVCRGLHAAHELRDPTTGQPLLLVHRDVSPQNVMIGYDGRVRLLDFGVAKIETENVTKTGEVKGKTAYMSPEQAMGDNLDRRSDLFGVGAILFECLALRRMWGDGTDMEVIRKLALEAPPSLEATGAPNLPPPLSVLYAKLVAREAAQRPANALDVASELDKLTTDSAEVEDSDAAKRALERILDVHFSEQADEQRARLTAALEEVAPSQADALRESVLPHEHPSRTSDAQPPKAKHDPEDSIGASAAPVGEARTSRVSWIAVGLVVIAGLVGWRLHASMTGAEAETPNHEPAPTAAPSVTAAPSRTVAASVTATPTATPSVAPSATPTMTTAPPSTRTASPHPTARPTATPHPTTTTTSSTPPVVSVKPPEIHDKNPF